MKCSQYTLNLAYLYPKSMNIYGDRGNIITLTNRCQWRGIKVNLTKIEVGDGFDPNQYDLVFAGGGQDVHQLRIADDLQDKKDQIKEAVEKGVVFLLICGSYQLFGHYFKTHEETKIPGISILDLYTVASTKRKIGNVSINHDLAIKPKTLVGFENHSGNTFITPNTTTKPIGKVISGFGNNGEDGYEGAQYKNVFGTYFHGSLLPKNPHFADYLIKTALQNKYNRIIKLNKLNNTLEYKAHRFILSSRK